MNHENNPSAVVILMLLWKIRKTDFTGANGISAEKIQEV